jgi:hypothetical protein
MRNNHNDTNEPHQDIEGTLHRRIHCDQPSGGIAIPSSLVERRGQSDSGTPEQIPVPADDTPASSEVHPQPESGPKLEARQLLLGQFARNVVVPLYREKQAASLGDGDDWLVDLHRALPELTLPTAEVLAGSRDPSDRLDAMDMWRHAVTADSERFQTLLDQLHDDSDPEVREHAETVQLWVDKQR